jgi:hypothetical protein
MNCHKLLLDDLCGLRTLRGGVNEPDRQIRLQTVLKLMLDIQRGEKHCVTTLGAILCD